jgi:putative NADH-flavin reductase
MNILLFGATGRTGRRILTQAVERGNSVVAFVRDPGKLNFTHPRLRIILGDVMDANAVANAIAGNDAVLSAIGKQDATRRVQALENIVAGMKRHNVQRIIAIGGSGCLQFDEQRRYHETPQFPEIFRNGSLAHWEVCQRLMTSGLDWTFVCPPDIPDGERTGKYITQATYRPNGNRVYTGDLADFMLNELMKNEFVKLRVGICSIQ